MIIENILNQAYQKLNNSNIKNANFDCEILLSNIINKKREYVILNSKKILGKKYVNIFNGLIERRKKGEPVAYLINEKEFWKEKFYVDNSVLIPRPDTELLIENVMKYTHRDSKLRVLDIGTGSGCILLSILNERKNFTGIGIDISKKSIKVSKYNAKKLKLHNRSKFYISDVDNFLIGKYDLVVSNPPYIENTILKYLDRDVVDYEPKLALKGGHDGFSEITKVINRTSNLIKKNGLFFLEIGHRQKKKTIEMLQLKGFYIKKVLKDYSKNDRCIIGTKI
tara:strand:+ start:3252 stop:4094 length:843 start_codon:yes stop_codon:yes gene_type:complete